MKSAHVRTFAPESWGEIKLFQNFYSGTHRFLPGTARSVSGCISHFEKAQVLFGVAVKIQDNLHIDHEELQAKSYSSAHNSREFSAVIEAIITELYSSVDCARSVVSKIYQKTRRIPDSTRKLFKRISDGELGSDFPSELKSVFISASWYEPLRILRDELTHSEIGHCSFDSGINKVRYMHTGIYNHGAPLIIDDIIGHIDKLFLDVNQFLGGIFHYLNGQLLPNTINVMCGIFYGRGYVRELDFDPKITFNSGRCQSYQWFEKDKDFTCPFSEDCGAYKTSKQGQDRTSGPVRVEPPSR